MFLLQLFPAVQAVRGVGVPNRRHQQKPKIAYIIGTRKEEPTPTKKIFKAFKNPSQVFSALINNFFSPSRL